MSLSAFANFLEQFSRKRHIVNRLISKLEHYNDNFFSPVSCVREYFVYAINPIPLSLYSYRFCKIVERLKMCVIFGGNIVYSKT